MSVWGRAEDAFHEMIKHAVIIILFLDERRPFMLAFQRATQGALQHVRVKFVLGQIILCAGPDDLRRELRIVGWAEYQNGKPWFFYGQQADLKQSILVRRRQINENRAERMIARKLGVASSMVGTVTNSFTSPGIWASERANCPSPPMNNIFNGSDSIRPFTESSRSLASPTSIQVWRLPASGLPNMFVFQLFNQPPHA